MSNDMTDDVLKTQLKKAGDDAAKQNRMMDLVLVIDTSGSMEPCIQSLVSSISGLTKTLVSSQGVNTVGNAVMLDQQIGIVAHDSTTFRVMKSTPFPADLAKVEAALGLLAGGIGGDEATLHAMDYAMDGPFWRPGQHRRCLVVFTDEPVSGGLATGITQQSIDKFKAKLGGVSLFFVGPIEDATAPFGYKALAAMGCTKGTVNIPDASSNAWQTIDFSKLMDKIGKTLTQAGAAEAGVQTSPDVFGNRASFRIVDIP